MAHSMSYRRILHRMGYYNYQQGLIFHHLDEEGSWNSHLKNCRNFIMKGLDYFKPSKVTVLGSGWLLDLPLKEMTDMVTEVNLVDIIHPPEVKEQVAGMNKVILREEDISGGLINDVWQKAGYRTFLNKLRSPDDIPVNEYQPGFETGMVISLNILTQLENLPLEFLRKKSLKNEESFLRFRARVQSEHISFLKKHESVLITDVSEVITARSGNVIENPSLLSALPEAKLREEWTWDFDLRKSDYYSKKSVFRVSAMLL
jgi:hypothetical protein